MNRRYCHGLLGYNSHLKDDQAAIAHGILTAALMSTLSSAKRLSQRKMMESMMKGQMENFEQMMSGDGPMSVEVRVKEVRINSGPPGGE